MTPPDPWSDLAALAMPGLWWYHLPSGLAFSPPPSPEATTCRNSRLLPLAVGLGSAAPDPRAGGQAGRWAAFGEWAPGIHQGHLLCQPGIPPSPARRAPRVPADGGGWKRGWPTALVRDAPCQLPQLCGAQESPHWFWLQLGTGSLLPRGKAAATGYRLGFPLPEVACF